MVVRTLCRSVAPLRVRHASAADVQPGAQNHFHGAASDATHAPNTNSVVTDANRRRGTDDGVRCVDSFADISATSSARPRRKSLPPTCTPDTPSEPLMNSSFAADLPKALVDRAETVNRAFERQQ
jgi:hypothetical protein